MSKVVLFKTLTVNTPFTPAVGEKGYGLLYLKKLNGCCPRLLAKEEEAIFWPNDKVQTVSVPEKVLSKVISE